MYEILAGMGAYISDYSSACFEAGYAHIPVFLYADDRSMPMTEAPLCGILRWIPGNVSEIIR